jgi:hypothetical protein
MMAVELDEALPPVQFHGWVPGAVRSIELERRHGFGHGRLHTWQDQGWIDSTEPRRGTGYGLWWSPVAQRMAAFLALENDRLAGTAGSMPPAMSELRRLTWRALQEWPTATCYVLVAGRLCPSWSDHTLARLLARARLLGASRIVVSVPLVADWADREPRT